MSNEFLQQRHATYHTPESTLRSLVQTAVGQKLRSATPIVQGYANEVYQIETQHHDKLIVRIGHAERTNFRAETWAMACAYEAGVPVPRIYDTTTITVVDQPREVMVMQAVPGRSVAEVQADLTQQQVAYIFEQVGAALSRLHTIHVAGFVHLHADGHGAFPDWHSFAQATHEQRVADLPFLLEAGLSEAEAQLMLEIVGEMKSFTDTQPVLCHGDLSTEHLFVDTELNLRGVIDFGQCQGGRPALDFAVLSMYHPEIDLAWLQRGYRNQVVFDSTFQRQVLVQQANVQMEYLAHDTREGNMDARDIALQSVQRLLHQWQTL